MSRKRSFSVFVVCGTMVAAFLATVPVADAAVRCLGKKATIVGTAGADKIKGTGGTDVIAGLNGNDVISGLGGNDLICGGSGNDKVNGGSGNDRISGDDGNDTIAGSAGSDTADFSSSPEGVDAELSNGTATGAGSDRLTGIENLVGSKHDDFLAGTDADNSVVGGSGDDTILGLEGDDALDGGNGIDFADFESATAAVTANLSTGTATGEGADTLKNFEALVGSPHDDTLTGDASSNIIAPLGGNDTCDGGSGEDYIEFVVSSAGVVVNLMTGTATGEGTDTIANFEDVVGSPGNDTITGNTGNNLLVGLTGDDTISGGDGNDVLLGLEGNDTLDGGNGNDYLDGGDGTDSCANGEASTNCES